jgi:2-dehydropantoate 2-reductase
MRIAVVGAGAMGTIFGAGFTEGGHETVLVDVSRPLVDRLEAEGATIDRKGEVRTVRVAATTDPSAVGPCDLVVFFVKCYQTAAAAEGARPLVGDSTLVASLQNGWGNGETLARTFSEERLAVGVTYHSGTVRGVGEIAHTGLGPTVVGAYADGDLDKVRPLVEAIESAGFDVTASPQIRTEIWKKLVVNAATLPTAALTGLTAGGLGEAGPMRDVVDEVTREAVATARAQGYEIDESERVEFIHGLLERAGPGKPSMLQDVEAGRRTEIDVINGAVVRAARDHGVETPLNRTLVAMVKAYERAHSLA